MIEIKYQKGLYMLMITLFSLECAQAAFIGIASNTVIDGDYVESSIRIENAPNEVDCMGLQVTY